jgi:hypothetical protein
VLSNNLTAYIVEETDIRSSNEYGEGTGKNYDFIVEIIVQKARKYLTQSNTKWQKAEEGQGCMYQLTPVRWL